MELVAESDAEPEEQEEEGESAELLEQQDREGDAEVTEDEASDISSSPSDGGERVRRRGRSRSPKGVGKKKGGKRSKSKSPKTSKSPGGSKRSRSTRGSKSPSGKKSSKSRSKSPKGSGKGKKKKKTKKGSGKGLRRSSTSAGLVGRQELQAALDRAVYEARIKDLELQLARARKQRAEAVQVTSDEDQVHDLVGKELQVELEVLQNAFQELLTKEAEDRRIRKKQDARAREEMQRQAEALRVAQNEVEDLKQKVAENRDLWEESQVMLAERDRLLKENKELRGLLREREDTIREYESRFTLIHRATMKAAKTGRAVTTIGGATGLIPVLLEGMKMFPHDRVLQREVCLLITHIAFTPEDYIVMSEFEGLELILEALRNHRSSKPLVASCLRMLWKFATASQELRDKLRGYEGLPLILHLLAIIPHGTIRRMEFFGGRLLSYLLPEHVSTQCPMELVMEEHAVASGGSQHTRRASETALPFLTGTQDLAFTGTLVDTRRSTAVMTLKPPPGPESVTSVLPGAKGESGRLTLTSRELIKIVVVEFDAEAAGRLRRRREEEQQLEGVVAEEQSQEGQCTMRDAPEEEQEELWRPNPELARKMLSDAVGALVATVDAPDDSSGCRRLLFSEPSLAILVRAWRAHFSSVDVVVGCCMIVRTSLVADPQRRAEQLLFLRDVGLDKVLKASERRHKGNGKVLSELVTLSRIFFVEVQY